jgi:hypothetical protein
VTKQTQTILLDEFRLDGDTVRLAIETRGETEYGAYSGVQFSRVPRTEFEAMIRAYNALVYEEQDKP